MDRVVLELVAVAAAAAAAALVIVPAAAHPVTRLPRPAARAAAVATTTPHLARAVPAEEVASALWEAAALQVVPLATWPFPGCPVLLLRKRPHQLQKIGVTLK